MFKKKHVFVLFYVTMFKKKHVFVLFYVTMFIKKHVFVLFYMTMFKKKHVFRHFPLTNFYIISSSKNLDDTCLRNKEDFTIIGEILKDVPFA